MQHLCYSEKLSTPLAAVMIATVHVMRSGMVLPSNYWCVSRCWRA